MVTVEKVDNRSRSQVRRFVDLPFRLYAGHPQWVPPLRSEIRAALDPRRHPFYERSDADFFIAVHDGRDVGRIAALENRPYNDYHGIRHADFYFFDCENDQEAASALLTCVFEWARMRGLTHVVGPKGFSALDGYGILVEGFEHRQMMMMMNYNFPYYAGLLEGQGFEKHVDFISSYVHKSDYCLPDRIRRAARVAEKKGTLQVKRFRNKRELVRWAQQIGEAYNKAFVHNWEYYPLSPRQIDYLVKSILLIADHRLIKVMTHGNDVVGFLFAFPDLSAALQRIRGRLFPTGVLRLLLEMRRTNWVSLNGAGILPEFHGIGGNALLYSEMEKTVDKNRFEHVDLTQVAEVAVQMQQDLAMLGARPYKRHRVFVRKL